MPLTSSTMPIPLLAQWLTGEFDNKAQSLDQPIWFVHLRLWHRPLPIRINGNLALFAEQANMLNSDRPYRQRIFELKPTSDAQVFQAQYWAFRQPEKFKGAGANPQLLEALSLEDLETLPGCSLTVRQSGSGFKAEPDDRCFFQYDGKTRQVILGFEVSTDRFLSYDRGVDPETGAVLWGAMMGAYEYQRLQVYEWQDV